MAKRQGTTFLGLAPETMIEVIGIKDGKNFKMEMTFSAWLSFKKKPGWVYKPYQLKFSQFNLENK